MSKRKWYVGIRGSTRTPFPSAFTPTPSTTPDYLAVVGPFVTKRAALFLARYGGNNPHIQHVNDAERISKQEADA